VREKKWVSQVDAVASVEKVKEHYDEADQEERLCILGMRGFLFL